MPSRTNLARIGYMTQADGIYPELSVWENLSFFAALYGQTDKAEMIETLRARRAGQAPRDAGAPDSRAACGAACRWPARWSTARR